MDRTSTLTKTFTNEDGVEVTLVISVDDRGVTIRSTGTTSEVEQTWTPVEASWLLELLNNSFNDIMRKRVNDLIKKAEAD